MRKYPPPRLPLCCLYACVHRFWLIEHGLTSAPTQYRLYGRRFLQVWWPNQQCQSTEGGWLLVSIGIYNLHCVTVILYDYYRDMQQTRGRQIIFFVFSAPSVNSVFWLTWLFFSLLPHAKRDHYHIISLLTLVTTKKLNKTNINN